MHNLGIIPARGGSQRVPGKNLRPLLGKPLIVWAIEAARAASCLSRLVVSSDDPAILNIAAWCDPGLVLKRPDSLAGNRSPAIDYVRHALDVLEAEGEGPFEAVTIVQPTSPLVTSEDIDRTVNLLGRTGADTAVSIAELNQIAHPVKLKVLRGDRLLPYLEEERGCVAAEELPAVYSRNGAVYATRRHVIDTGQIIGEDCRGYLMPPERSVDINEEIDLLFAEFLLARSGYRKAA